MPSVFLPHEPRPDFRLFLSPACQQSSRQHTVFSRLAQVLLAYLRGESPTVIVKVTLRADNHLNRIGRRGLVGRAPDTLRHDTDIVTVKHPAEAELVMLCTLDSNVYAKIT
jgi:hypothetical protein